MSSSAVKRNREEESWKMAGTKKKSQKYSNDEREEKSVVGGKRKTATRRRSNEMGKKERIREVVEEGETTTTVPVLKVVENSPEILLYWDEWPCFSSVVDDQQMLWGSLWFPFWDEEFISGVYAQNNDVIWEDDLWQLKDIKEIPNP